jgi:hypothetical protein
MTSSGDHSAGLPSNGDHSAGLPSNGNYTAGLPSNRDYTAGLPSKRMGAGVLFRNAAGDVLLVEPTYVDHWELPGGTVEADESPRAAAVRGLRRSWV